MQPKQKIITILSRLVLGSFVFTLVSLLAIFLEYTVFSILSPRIFGMLRVVIGFKILLPSVLVLILATAINSILIMLFLNKNSFNSLTKFNRTVYYIMIITVIMIATGTCIGLMMF